MQRIKDVRDDISDPIELAIFQSSIHSITEEMGAALRRTSISPNIKERRDYSCALFDGRERVIARRWHPVRIASVALPDRGYVRRRAGGRVRSLRRLRVSRVGL